jgi:hypothetical protein
VAGRIQADPHVVLGLEVRQGSALGQRVRDPGLQVIDLDLQVHHHLLLSRAGRPDRADVARFGLEVQSVAAAGRAEDHPAGFLGSRRPAQQPAIEVRERVRVGRVDVGPGERQRRLWHSHMRTVSLTTMTSQDGGVLMTILTRQAGHPVEKG